MATRCMILRGGIDDDSLFDVSQEANKPDEALNFHVEGVEDSVLDREIPTLPQGTIHYVSSHSEHTESLSDSPKQRSTNHRTSTNRRSMAQASEDDLSKEIDNGEEVDVDQLTAELDAEIQTTIEENLYFSDSVQVKDEGRKFVRKVKSRNAH
eukprot:680816-Hanusia_phi.AAC.1